MAALRFAARGFVSEGHSIETVLARLRGLLDIATAHQFATVLIGELDLSSRRLWLVSAGHFPPVFIDARGARLLDCPTTPPVGVTAPGDPRAVEVGLPRTGTLLAFTDGAVERRGEVVDTGITRLRAAAAPLAADPRPLAESLDGLLAAVTAHGGKDDTVLLGMRRTG
jgi:serine phosphatase RsbU (regulator of sigma subunit)